jgi:hypothetical protein
MVNQQFIAVESSDLKFLLFYFVFDGFPTNIKQKSIGQAQYLLHLGKSLRYQLQRLFWDNTDRD